MKEYTLNFGGKMFFQIKIIVFLLIIAEIIIAISLILNLIKLDKKIIGINNSIIEYIPKITTISDLFKKISYQLVELSEDFVKKLKENQELIGLFILKKILVSILIWRINYKIYKKFKKSLIGKIIKKCFKVIQNVI